MKNAAILVALLMAGFMVGAAIGQLPPNCKRQTSTEQACANCTQTFCAPCANDMCSGTRKICSNKTECGGSWPTGFYNSETVYVACWNQYNCVAQGGPTCVEILCAASGPPVISSSSVAQVEKCSETCP